LLFVSFFIFAFGRAVNGNNASSYFMHFVHFLNDQYPFYGEKDFFEQLDI